jgi:hypothetical protein
MLSCGKPELRRILDHAVAVCGFEQGLAWHTPVENAKAPEFVCSLDNGGPEAEGVSRPCTGIAGTPPTDHHKIVCTHAFH